MSQAGQRQRLSLPVDNQREFGGRALINTIGKLVLSSA